MSKFYDATKEFKPFEISANPKLRHPNKGRIDVNPYTGNRSKKFGK